MSQRGTEPRKSGSKTSVLIHHIELAFNAANAANIAMRLIS